MILLLSVSPLGQTGMKRLHPTWRRIRRHELRSGCFASLNKRDFDLYLVFTAPPFSKRRRLRNPGLKTEPMYPRGEFISHQLAAAQKRKGSLSVATAVSEFPNVEPQSPRTFVLKEKPTSQAPAGFREWRTPSGRNSVYFTAILDAEPVAEAFDKRPIALVCALNEPCFSGVARQPQQPVVQALKAI